VEAERLNLAALIGTLVTWTYDKTYRLTGEKQTDAGGSTTLTGTASKTVALIVHGQRISPHKYHQGR
jgi:hypothetical protein